MRFNINLAFYITNGVLANRKMSRIQAQNRAIEMVASIEEAEDNAMAIVTQYLGSMDPYQFQNLIGALLEGMNYHVSWIAPPGRDGGVDIIAFQDPLGRYW
jgi:restriction system protein